MNPPIILLELDDGTVEAFASIDEASLWVEPIDVENGEYVAWDSQGLRLCLSVTEGRVCIEPDPSGVIETAELERALRSDIGISSTSSGTGDASLSDMVEQALAVSAKERYRYEHSVPSRIYRAILRVLRPRSK